jgi:MscS family membrane protein
MYVPNATFTTLTVENPSRMTHRRIFEHIGVRYEDQAVVRELVDAIRSMIQSHPDVATDQIIMVHFDRFGPSSLDIMVYCFTRTTDWATYHGVREDVLLKIADIIVEHDAEVAFPTRTVHLHSSAPHSNGGAPDDV